MSPIPSASTRQDDRAGPLQRAWPLVLVGVVAAGELGWHYARIRGLCGGALVYGLDDAYIHLTLAHNLVEHGTWGLNPGEFAAISSSILWPLLLAAIDAVTGLGHAAPLCLNLLLVALALWRVDGLLAARPGLPPAARAGVLLVLFLFTPMPSLVFNGMEHLLQILLTVELIHRAGRVLGREPASGDRRHAVDAVWLVALAALGTLVRYEAVFQVAAVSGMLLWRRSWTLAAVVAAAGALPIVLYGGWMVHHGWPFLPPSLTLKTFVIEPTVVDAGRRAFNQFASKVPAGMVLVLAFSFVFLRFARRGPSAPGPDRIDEQALLVFAVPTVLHLLLAELGNLFRYEAYLYAGGIFVLAGPLWSWLRDGWARWRAGPAGALRLAGVAVAVVFLSFPLVQRGLASYLGVPLMCRDIHAQQVQMARFLDEHFAGQTVAVNDIGAVSYFADVRIVDVWGLATLEVAELRHQEQFPGEALVPILREQGAEIALVYAPWIGEVPASWTKVGQWTVEEKIVLGWFDVSFYATEPGAIEPLTEAFLAYEPRLPDGVESDHEGPW